MPSFNCKQCNKEFTKYDSLRKHMSRIHKIDSETFYRNFYLQGKAPEPQQCKCGCKQITGYHGLGRWADYCKGHIARVHNNWGHNQKAINNSAKTRRERFATGEISTWNKGLTIDDPRVAENIRKMNTPERAAKISAALKGVAKSPEHAAKSRKHLAEYWSKQENRDKQSLIRSIYMRTMLSNKPSKLELYFKEILTKNNIDFEFQYIVGGLCYDFKIKDTNILIEVDGDWYHCNPNLQIEAKYNIQKHTIEHDKLKNRLASENGFKLLRFWEHDINNNIQQVVKTLLNEL